MCSNLSVVTVDIESTVDPLSVLCSEINTWWNFITEDTSVKLVEKIDVRIRNNISHFKENKATWFLM